MTTGKMHPQTAGIYDQTAPVISYYEGKHKFVRLPSAQHGHSLLELETASAVRNDNTEKRKRTGVHAESGKDVADMRHDRRDCSPR